MQKDRIHKDVVLHKRVRQFLKSQALKMLMTQRLGEEDTKLMELCVCESEYHEKLALGQMPDKEKFIRMISESYGWEPSARTTRGRPRKGGSRPEQSNARNKVVNDTGRKRRK